MKVSKMSGALSARNDNFELSGGVAAAGIISRPNHGIGHDKVKWAKDLFKGALSSAYAQPQPSNDAVKSESRAMSDPTREEIQAQIAASEARGEIKVARLEGKIETLGAILGGKMDSLKEDIHKADSYNRDTRLLTLGTIIAAAIALGGVFVAMATYGDALFGRGMNVRDAIQTTIKDTLEQVKKDAPKPQQ